MAKLSQTRRGLLIGLGILIILGVAAYFLFFYNRGEERGGPLPDDEINGNGNGTKPPPLSPIKVGDTVYLDTDKSEWVPDYGIPIYTQPVSDEIGSFLKGVVRGDWYAGVPIGKVIEMQPGWTKINVNNLQIWKFIVNTGYTNQLDYLTGDFWISDKALYKL